MKWPLQWYDCIQFLGALASITGLSVLSSGVSDRTHGYVLALAVVGVFGVIIASVIARAQPMLKVGRDAMIDTGRSLIRGAKSTVILFGGDMSWAPDYEEAVRHASDRGKSVRVIFPVSTAPKVEQNAMLLAGAGAALHPTPFDSGLRAILVDPADEHDALLYVTDRRLKRGTPQIQVGERGTEHGYDYVAKIYRTRRDGLLIRAIHKTAELLPRTEAPWPR